MSADALLSPEQPVVSRRRPWAFLIALVVVLALEMFLHANRHRLVDGVEANLMAKAARMRDADLLPDDVAIFGDSKMFSVRPDAIAAAAAAGGSLQVSNYSWPFFGIEAYELMLDMYLRHRPAPRTIILNGRPELVGLPETRNSLALEPAHRHRAFVALPFRQILSLAVQQKAPALVWHWLEGAMTPPSARYRDRAPEALRDVVRGREWPLSKDYIRMTKSYNETGAFLMHRRRQVTEAEVRAVEQVEGPYDIYQNHEQAASFERFLKRTAEAEIRVLVLGSPAPPQVNEQFEKIGIHQAYRAVLEHWQEKFGNLQIIEPLYPVQPLHHFGDAGHLNTEGDAHFQVTYPGIVAEALRRLK